MHRYFVPLKNALPCITLHCSSFDTTLYCMTLHYNVPYTALECIILHDTTLQRMAAVYCITLQDTTLLSTILYDTVVDCSDAERCTALCWSMVCHEGRPGWSLEGIWTGANQRRQRQESILRALRFKSGNIQSQAIYFQSLKLNFGKIDRICWTRFWLGRVSNFLFKISEVGRK